MLNRTLYNETHQNRKTAPTAYESLLGDNIERAFAAGVHNLDGLVAYLNAADSVGPDGKPWTAESYCAEMARLGA